MKKWLLHIMFVSVLGMLAASCSQDADDPTQTNLGNGTIRIQFSLDLDESRAVTDEAWGEIIDTQGNRVIGDTYENKINLDKLQVFLFNADGTYMGEVGGLTLSPSTSSNTYTFTGEVTVSGANVTTSGNSKVLAGYTIMVVANYEGYVNGNLAVTQNYLFDYIAENYRPTAQGTATSYIPMWGMLKTDITLNETDAQSYTSIGDIYMLRSLAKIEVNLASTLDNYKITSATLNKHNQAAYLLPSVPSNSNSPYFEQENTSAFYTEACFNPASRTNGASLSFNQKSDRQWFIYVPEYDNDGSLQIALGLANGNKDITNAVPSNIIYLNEYSKGEKTDTPIEIVRNHWYQYTINTISDGIGATLKVKVADWDTDEESWNYKEQPSVESGGQMTWMDVQENEEDKEFTVAIEGTNVFVPIATEEKPAVCTFRISTPVGATWYATFETVEGVYGAFKFLDADGNEVPSVSGKVGDLAKLSIITTNTAPTVRSSAILRIVTRTSDGRTMIVKELVQSSTNAEYTLVQSIQ